MIGGKRYAHDDKEFSELLNYLQERFRAGNVTNVFSAFPFLKKVFPKWSGQKRSKEIDDALRLFFLKSFEEHKNSSEGEPRDLIDVYISEIKAKKNEDTSFQPDNLMNVCFDLFSAGAESTGNTLGFCLLYLVLYPEWQQTLFEEVTSMIGKDKKPTLSDKSKLPKLEAFLAEVMRSNPIAALTVPHRAIQDCYLNGYVIPKDTFVLISLWSLLQDKKHWNDPENFRPERFLDRHGNFRKDDWMHIFGLGKRICPGETLARSVIFLFLTVMIQKFSFSIPQGHPMPSTVCLPGFTQAPQHFEIKVTSRE